MITGNEPAMPTTLELDYTSNGVTPSPHNGLTIRQHFAAMAMAADDYESPTSQYDHRAKIWLAKADALIAELNKPQPK